MTDQSDIDMIVQAGIDAFTKSGDEGSENPQSMDKKTENDTPKKVDDVKVLPGEVPDTGGTPIYSASDKGTTSNISESPYESTFGKAIQDATNDELMSELAELTDLAFSAY